MMINPSSPKPIAQRITRSLEYAWDHLTLPAATIREGEHRQQARLLSSLLLALILVITFILTIRTVGEILWPDFTTPASVGAIAILIAIYSLSRTQYYFASANLTVAALFGLIHTAPLWAYRLDHALFYATLPILLSGILLSLPAMLCVALISLGDMLLLVLLSPRGTDLYLAPLSYTLISTAIIVTFIYHRDWIERARQAALRTSENNYRLLLEQASDGIFITDAQGNYLMVNSKGREMLGASTKDLLQRNIKDNLVSAGLTDSPLRLDELSVGKTIIAECYLDDKNNRLIPAEVSIKRLDDGRLQAIVRDITKRRRAEEALRLKDLAIASTVTGIVFTDFENRVTYVNRAFLTMWGYEREEEVLGRLATEFVPIPGQLHEIIELLHQYGSLSGETSAKKKDDTSFFVQFTAVLVADETGTPLAAMGTCVDITERKQSEAALRLSEERFRQVITSISDHIYTMEVTTTGSLIYRYSSPNFEALTGYLPEKFTANWDFWVSTLIYPEDRAIAVAQRAQVAAGQSTEIECRLVRADGRVIWVRHNVKVEPAEAGSKKIYGVLSDITRSKELEGQLRQAQKMEAIGQLAGGVAHDFNNILTVITGYTALLLQDLDAHDPLSHDIGQIQKSADRAAALTRQLLAFSRRQLLQPIILDFNAIVTNLDKMLRRLIGEDIDLTILLNPTLGRIKADPGQIEQVIINLALNARDAMPQGGKLTIETKTVYLDEAYVQQHVNIKIGTYIMLAMSDTGNGMNEETRSHIFEPFFTTKEQGKGTGLGLATVHGIVNQSGGHVWVYSEPGQGTTFKVYLPQVEEIGHGVKPNLQAATSSKRGSETILLVEDEDSVRELARRALFNEGYIVLEASHGEEALRVAQQHQGPIDLLVTDVIMPAGMSGRQLVERLIPLRQEMRVLYMSGYTDDAIVRHGVLNAGIAFLQKPFSPNHLASKVREVLDMPSHPAR